MADYTWDDEFPDIKHLDPPELNDSGVPVDPEEMKELLNSLDDGIIGVFKPRIDHVIIEREPIWDWYEQDNNPASPLEQDLE